MRAPSRAQLAAVLGVLWLGLAPTGGSGPVPAVFSAPGPDERTPLTALLPDAVPSPPARASWETVTGEVEHAGTVVRYRFFVNPAYRAMYQITQYRMWKTDGSRTDTEKVLWNEEPGSRRPLRVFERVDGAWRPIPEGTPEYTREIVHVIRVYDLHRQAHGLGAGYSR